MGLVICATHGEKIIMFACPHVSAAVVSHTACHNIEWREYVAANAPELSDISLGCWFCQSCIVEHSLPPHGSTIPAPEEFLEMQSWLYRPMCPDCFKEWQACGLGDITSA